MPVSRTSAVSRLALSYLASATVFALAAVLAAHPDPGPLARQGAAWAGAGLNDHVWQPVLAALRRADATFLDRDTAPVVTMAITPPGPHDARTLARSYTLDIAPRSLEPAPDSRFADSTDGASASITILPDLQPPPDAVAASPLVLPEPPPLEKTAPGTIAAARAIAVSERLKENLSPEMLKAFDLFLYVSKSERGPLAQRMYVFRKGTGGKLALLYDWPASTGREQQEISPRGRASFTGTPRGFYELDPDRMYRKYRSWSWDQPMPYAMFFNWERRGLQTGLAIHAASGEGIARLGRRASAGCVHLAPENARTLYNLIRNEYRGQVPRFAYDARTQTMRNDGTLMRGANGKLKMADGYKVLVQIEDYSGANTVAALF